MGGTIHTQVMVLLDGSPQSNRALPIAGALARSMSEPTTLISAITNAAGAELARERLVAAAAEFPGEAVVEVRRGRSVRSELLACIRHHPSALIVVATHARGPLSESILGSVAGELVRHSPHPILLVGPRVADPPPGGYVDLLACMDGTDRSERLVPMVTGARDDLGLRPVVLQVAHHTDGHGGTGTVAGVLDRLAASGVRPEHLVVIDESASQGIVDAAAKRPASVIAIATEGRDPIAR